MNEEKSLENENKVKREALGAICVAFPVAGTLSTFFNIASIIYDAIQPIAGQTTGYISAGLVGGGAAIGVAVFSGLGAKQAYKYLSRHLDSGSKSILKK